MKNIKHWIGALLLTAFGSAQAAVIDFDGTGAPCTFAATSPLTTFYAAQGVTFQGVGSAGGSILNQCGNFGFNAHSGTDFLAFNTFITGNEADLLFSANVSDASIWFASISGGNFSMQAFNTDGNLLDVAVMAASNIWQQISVSGGAISRVRLTGGGGYYAYDDLQFNVAAQVPEPATLALLGLGLLGFGMSRKRSK